jgi:hypothetical protein
MVSLKDWEWIDYFRDQMNERGITSEMVEDTLLNPDKIVPGKENRHIYQKKIMGKLLRVITEGNRLITVYFTSKIKKCMEGDKI